MQPLCQDHTGIQYHRHNLTEYGKCTTRMDSNVRVHKKTHTTMERNVPAPAKASRSSPLESDRAMMVLAAAVYSPSLLEGKQISFTPACVAGSQTINSCICIKCCQAQVILSMQSQHGQNNGICPVSILCIIAYCLGVEVIGMHGCLGTKHRTSKPQAVSTKRSTWVLC